MANQYWHTVKNGIVYDKNWKYLWHEDIVYWGNKWGTIAPNTSEATANAQPSKTMNGGSAKIDGANPSSPSTNPATRRSEYALGQSQWQWSVDYNNMLEILSNTSENNKNWIVEPTKTATTTPNSTLDLKAKGNFDMYEPKIDDTNADATFQKAVSQLNDSIKGLGSLKLASENYQYTTGSTNVADINNLIKEIQKAYTAWIYDTATIANNLWVDQEVIRKIQQGKASELVSIGEEFAQEQLKNFFRAEEDYDTNLQRTMEDYNLAKTNLDAQFNSAMQTLKRSMFDEKRAAKVWSAIADRSGSEYMIQRVEKGYQQNMDDLENNYIYSSLTQRASYIRAIQDYNTNIQRLWEDFDDAVKSIQLSVLQQFQEIDNKILTAEDNLKALSKLQGSTSTAMSDAILKYISWIEDANERQQAMQKFIAANYGYDVSQLSWTNITSEDVANAYNWFVTKFADVIKNGGKIRQWRCGEPVNEYLKFLWMDLQIAQANDLKPYAKSQTPTQGSIAYFDWTQKRATPDGKKYGHTGIVVDYDMEKWTVTLLESNKNTGMRTHTYKLSDVTGYLDPTKQGTSIGGETTSSGWTGWYYRSIDDGLYEAYANREKALSSQESKNIKEDSYYWSNADERWNNFVAAADIYKQNQTANEIKNIQSSRDLIKNLRDDFEKATKWLSDFDISQWYKAYKQLKNWDEITIKGITADWLTKDHKDLLNAFSEYDQFLAQWFIDTIISSKKKWASYGPLSDNEWNSLREAYTAANMYIGRDNMITQLDKMISNLDTNIKEMTPKQTTTDKGWDSSNKKSYSLSDIITWLRDNIKFNDASTVIKQWSSTSDFDAQWDIILTWGTADGATTGTTFSRTEFF